MRTTFFGFEIARKALMANQKALDVTAHNIANANTQGYSRQEAVMETTDPYTIPSLSWLAAAGQTGTGVKIQEIRRVRDSFLDLQYRAENRIAGFWDGKRDGLQKLEVIFNEISDSGLRTVFSQFWDSLQELSMSPESNAIRAVVKQRAVTLVETFNHLDRQLTDLQVDVNNSIKIKVTEINSLARQISDLNDQVVKVEVAGQRANDLRDKRDLLIDQISKLVDVTVSETEDGSANVSIGGNPLVMGVDAREIAAVGNPLNNGYVDLQWVLSGSAVSLEYGLMKGYLDMRDIDVPNYRTMLNDFANTLVTQVNLIHNTGFDLNNGTGNDFFDPAGTDAKTIAVDAVILGDLNAIATASAAGQPGDGSIALQMAQLKQSLIMSGNTATFDDFFRGMVSDLGVASQEATRMTEGQDFLMQQLDYRKQEASGVSLDEEMSNMIRFQHSYNASAKLITTMDQMLDTIINRMGAM